MGGWDGWRDFKPGPRTPATTVKVATDRGSRRGAKRCIVTPELQIIDHATAKQAGLTGVFFQSMKEAKFYIQLEIQFRAGVIRPIPGQDRWRQVKFPLMTTTPDGLKVIIAHLILDFVYERHVKWHPEPSWTRHYQDVKPGGGFREDTYILKKPWFEAQYGVAIEEL